MLMDGIELVEGSDAKNLVIEKGNTLPINITEGRLFYLSGHASLKDGLYQYKDKWLPMVEEDDVKLVKTKMNTAGFGVIKNNELYVSGYHATGIGTAVGTYSQQKFTRVPFDRDIGAANIIESSMNRFSVFVVLDNGEVYSFGRNTNGAQGHGNTTDTMHLTRIQYFVDNNINIVKVFQNDANTSNSINYAMFLSDTGTLYSCGYNAFGQLGIGNTTQQTTPVEITAITSPVIDVSLSPFHAIVMCNDNKIYTWGFNGQGQLGVGNTTTQSTPQLVYSNANDAPVKILAECGKYYNGSVWGSALGQSFYLLDNGVLMGAGYTAQGQLGIGSTTRQTNFVQCGTGVTDVDSAGGIYGHTLIIKNGNVWSTGFNAQGQLGIGNTTQQLSFVDTGNQADFIYVESFSRYSVSYIKHNGVLYACGYGGAGTLASGGGKELIIETFRRCIGQPDTVDEMMMTSTFNLYDISTIIRKGSDIYTTGVNQFGALGIDDTAIGDRRYDVFMKVRI